MIFSIIKNQIIVVNVFEIAFSFFYKSVHCRDSCLYEITNSKNVIDRVGLTEDSSFDMIVIRGCMYAISGS